MTPLEQISEFSIQIDRLASMKDRVEDHVRTATDLHHKLSKFREGRAEWDEKTREAFQEQARKLAIEGFGFSSGDLITTKENDVTKDDNIPQHLKERAKAAQRKEQERIKQKIADLEAELKAAEEAEARSAAQEKPKESETVNELTEAFTALGTSILTAFETLGDAALARISKAAKAAKDAIDNG